MARLFYFYNNGKGRGRSFKLRVVKLGCTRDSRKHFFKNRVITRWNLLDQGAVDATTVNAFKGDWRSWQIQGWAFHGFVRRALGLLRVFLPARLHKVCHKVYCHTCDVSCLTISESIFVLISVSHTRGYVLCSGVPTSNSHDATLLLCLPPLRPVLFLFLPSPPLSRVSGYMIPGKFFGIKDARRRVLEHFGHRHLYKPVFFDCKLL